jgi:hypothetical protein
MLRDGFALSQSNAVSSLSLGLRHVPSLAALFVLGCESVRACKVSDAEVPPAWSIVYEFASTSEFVICHRQAIFFDAGFVEGDGDFANITGISRLPSLGKSYRVDAM